MFFYFKKGRLDKHGIQVSPLLPFAMLTFGLAHLCRLYISGNLGTITEFVLLGVTFIIFIKIFVDRHHYKKHIKASQIL
jgi:hypothetical protein